MQKSSTTGLVRGIRRWDLIAIAINAIIGAGIFGLPAKVYSLIGSYSLFAFIACAFVVALIILCFAEVGSRFTETGGPYLYAREAIGPMVAFETGWLIWLARLTAFSANCNLLISYTSFFWPTINEPLWRTISIILVVSTLAGINLLGIRESALVINTFTIGKLIPILIFVVVGLFYIQPSAFALGPTPATGAFSQSVLLLVYAFSGFEMATIPAGEVRDPQKNVPIALIVALVVVAILYILIQVVCVGTLPELAQSQKPLADAGARFLGTAGGAIISAGAMISIFGNLNLVILSGSRVPFAMAEQKQLPALIGKVHPRFRTPYVAILFTAVLMLVFTLSSTFVAALTVSTIARLLTYAITCLSLPIFRRRKDLPAPSFKLPGGVLISILALILTAWLLMHSTLAEARVAVLAALAGIVVYLLYRFIPGSRKQPDHQQ